MNEERLSGMLLKITKHSDIAMAFLVVAVIALIVLPLPSPIVDTLIALNLGASVALLMISLYIPSALSLSTFPTLLLFTTLFRLALNITTTRQILLHAYAGKIIDTFGNMVVAGNLIVGSVVFLIITIVQFLVIAKGSERVAEVGARFTLDAMPGKQMSIDADMRAGTIDIDTARERRSALEKESQLYGAMDGAMKFVKNDAIAGLIVTAVNILGGMAVGMLQKDMGALQALETFSILTIGDGLISQIPALFISITSGIIVTRVGAGGSHLGDEIGGQLLGQPKALLLGGIVLLLFMLVPGFPKVQFLFLGLIVGGAGLLLHRRAQEQAAVEAKNKALGVSSSGAPIGEAQAPSPATPLILLLPERAMDALEETSMELLADIRNHVFERLGIPLPDMRFRREADLEDGHFSILLHETPLASGQWHGDRLSVLASAVDIQLIGVPFEENEAKTQITVALEHQEPLANAGLIYLSPKQALVRSIADILAKHGAEFLGMQETRKLLDGMEEQYGVLVKETLRVLPLPKVTDILKRLVQENLSIRDLRSILEAIINWAPKEKDMVQLTEYVRMAMSRYISHKYSGGRGLLAGYLFDPEVEELVRKSVRQTGGGSYLALDPKVSRKLIGTIKTKLGSYRDAPEPPVLISSMDIRRYVKKLVEGELEGIPVLSFQELGSHVTVQPLARISLAA